MGKLLLWKHFYAIYSTPAAVVGIVVIQFTISLRFFFFELKYYYFLIKSRIYRKALRPTFFIHFRRCEKFALVFVHDANCGEE